MAAIVSKNNRERNSEILKHYSRGHSYDAIGSIMGISRNVVAGVINRAGAKSRGGQKLPFDDLTGRVFGHLRVIGPAKLPYLHDRRIWICQCSCGTQRYVHGHNLRIGRTKSCGCGVVPKGRPRKAA